MIAYFLILVTSAFARDAAVVLISDSLPEYQETAKAFADTYPGTTQVYHIRGNKAKHSESPKT